MAYFNYAFQISDTGELMCSRCRYEIGIGNGSIEWKQVDLKSNRKCRGCGLHILTVHKNIG